ncbi:hypothetical protein [Rhodococcus wratislaviensis]|uniref:hypothetical protein n=1 Tax=Rhodococcus wratislaviensis TaxID=44752 RepID=UPI0036531743
MRDPVLDRHVDVAQLWQLASEAARKGEKWGQRKKSVSDAMVTYYAQLRRDRRGAKRWVAEVVDLLGYFDLSADWRAVEKGLQILDQLTVTSPVPVLSYSGWRSCRLPRRRTLSSRAPSRAESGELLAFAIPRRGRHASWKTDQIAPTASVTMREPGL